ncbi:MAG: hypothetical protein ACI4XE_00375 [Acutalibacteraceae bacterium]
MLIQILLQFTYFRTTLSPIHPAATAPARTDTIETAVSAKPGTDTSQKAETTAKNTQFGLCVFALHPGDGSAREQAAFCQKILGGFANICYEFATKRYRSNCIDWGILPFTISRATEFNYTDGDYVYVPGICEAIKNGKEEIPAKVITKDGIDDITLYVKGLTEDEKEIILDGCLMNYYKARREPTDYPAKTTL